MQYKKIDFKKVGQNIKLERLKQDLPREKLGAMAGLTGATINNMENNTQTALLRNVVAVSKALDVPLEKILY